jgi:hypothetical protein
MKPITVFLLLGLMVTRAFASDLVIAPSTSESSGCDLAVAGFNSKETFLKFFDQLQSATAKKDQAALAKLILYPMRVNGKTPKTIRTPSDFLKNFDSTFTVKIQNVIAKQRADQLFCRDQGVMFGNGELWVGIAKNKIGIKSLNLF